jgi:cell division protein FtsB
LKEDETARGQRTYPPILVLVVVALLLLLGIASLGSYRDLQAAHQRQELLETKIEATRQRNRELSRRIQRLQDDPLAIERLAREHYGMMYPGDVVIVLPEEPPAVTPVSFEPETPEPVHPGTG